MQAYAYFSDAQITRPLLPGTSDLECSRGSISSRISSSSAAEFELDATAPVREVASLSDRDKVHTGYGKDDHTFEIVLYWIPQGDT